MGLLQKQRSKALTFEARQHIQLINPGDTVVLGHGKDRNYPSLCGCNGHAASRQQMTLNPFSGVFQPVR